MFCILLFYPFPLVLPLTREWIEIDFCAAESIAEAVLPLTREWIEIFTLLSFTLLCEVLPLTREWIEMSSSIVAVVSFGCSPSYEGVD